MKREGTLKELSDGRLYDKNDMVRADCQGCRGCSECCRGMGDSIVLDPLDVYRLSEGLRLPAEELFRTVLELGVCDGNLLPHLRSGETGEKQEACVFLNTEGRCRIHPYRPGFCRMFPLGRYYENGGFHYILQIHECPKKDRSKIKVKKWLDTPELDRYEKFVTDWHYFLLDIQEVLSRSQDENLIRNLSLYVVNRFYMKPYDSSRGFYQQFYERLAEGRSLLELG